MEHFEDPFHRAIYLTGPTASGKTAVGVELARRIDAEVVALDSMTLYRGLDIGTAKPTAAERGEVPHHLIDVLDPWESSSVAWWPFSEVCHLAGHGEEAGQHARQALDLARQQKTRVNEARAAPAWCRPRPRRFP